MNMELLNRYNGKPHSCGVYDCNLMVLEFLSMPEYEMMKGTFTTRMGGFRVAKKVTGYPTLLHLLIERCEEIEPAYARAGDVFYNVEEHNCGIHLGSRVFAVDKEKQIYMAIHTSNLNLNKFKIFRGK